MPKRSGSRSCARTAQLAPPGETGRVIVTAFYNYAMPFIRYEVGDYAVVGPARAKCRIKLPTLSRVLGALSQHLHAQGRPHHLSLCRHRPVSRFHLVRAGAGGADRLRRDRGALRADRRPAADAAGLEAYLREAIDRSFNVSVVATDEIPRSPSGKFEDFLSLVPRLPQSAP